MKHPFLTSPVIAVTLLLSGCGTTEMEKRLEKNFVYQCSVQLFEKLDRKVTGADAEKICAAAHKAEMDEEARKGSTPGATTTATPAIEAKTEATPAPAKPAAEESDEVKPEPTPKK